MFLGAYNGQEWAVRSHMKHLGSDEAKAFVCTFNVFRAVFQVCGHFVRDAHLEDRRAMSIGLWTIWPPRSEALSWPRDQLAFGDELLVELAESVNA